MRMFCVFFLLLFITCLSNGCSGWITIPKTTSSQRMVENAAVIDAAACELTDEDMATLNGMNEDLVTGWDPTTSP
jgi:diketogulonate reductase-like aldo/keto reductase